MKKYVADFETTVEKEKTRVWMWGFSEIGNVDNFEWGSTIVEFFQWLKKENKQIWFHNLKFDGEFLIYYLLTNGFSYSDKKESRTFNTIISSTGAFYKIEIIFEKKNKKYKKVEIFDSHKKLPFPVKVIGDAFGLPYNKLEVGKGFYERHRPEDHVHTQEEIDYMEGDVKTVAAALGIQFEQDMDKMTVGSDALSGFKKILGDGDLKRGKKNFERDFPILPIKIDTEIRAAYRGGYVYVREDKAGKNIKKGKVFDINSLYPWVMKYCLLPYGMPFMFKGQYKENPLMPLYIQRIKCSFTLKKDHLPTIQIKHGGRFNSTEYLTTSVDKMGNSEVDLVLTSVDLKLFFDHYDVKNVEWKGGWMFKAAVGMFDEYIDYWMHIKETSTGAIRTLSKLMLNSLYGKFCKNPIVDTKMPYINEKGSVSYTVLKQDLDKPVYTAMGAFITAYARDKTIRTGQSVYDVYLYADTDSLHIEGDVTPDIEVHPTKLGAWKHEGDFTRARFLRPKTYIEEMDGVLHVTCAGMPDNVKESVTWKNFKEGSEFFGKLMPTHVVGGIVLQPTTFKISA